MAKKTKAYNQYTVKLGDKPNVYLVSKLSVELEVLGMYTITEHASGTLDCNCPAFKPWCRHKDLLRKFQAEKRVNLGWFYIPETTSWIPPMAVQS